MRAIAFVLVVLPLAGGAVLTACPPPLPVPPQPDADAAPAPLTDASTACVAACATLAALQCSEGRSPTCAISMQRIEADRLLRLPNGQPMTCAGCMLAQNTADIRNLCGSSCSP